MWKTKRAEGYASRAEGGKNGNADRKTALITGASRGIGRAIALKNGEKRKSTWRSFTHSNASAAERSQRSGAGIRRQGKGIPLRRLGFFSARES
jgi:hypothetical protein